MRIAHLCLASYYVDGMLYQENALVQQHMAEGHDVVVIASTESLALDGTLNYVPPSRYQGQDGAPVVRLPFDRRLPYRLNRKARAYDGLTQELETFKPELIIFHGASAWALVEVARFVRKTQGTRLLIDSHSDANNSAQSFASKHLLHRWFYRYALHQALPLAEAVLCVSLEVLDFMHELYDVPLDRLVLFPLGGWAIGDEEYARRRRMTREGLGIADHHVLFVQSGKFGAKKRLDETLQSFAAVETEWSRLVVAGEIEPSLRGQLTRLIEDDSRVTYVGWQSPEELTDLLCACDVYVQPGSQSATLQHSLCCRCAIAAADVRSHEPYFVGNGWRVSTREDLVGVFRSAPHSDLRTMSRASHELAATLLDYRYQSARLLSGAWTDQFAGTAP